MLTPVCPGVLVNESKSMKQLMNRSLKPVVETARVQFKKLPASPHPKLTGALSAAADNSHVIDAVAIALHKGDAGGSAGDVVHCLPDRGSVAEWKIAIELVLNYPKGPAQVRVDNDSVEEGRVGDVADQNVAFEGFFHNWWLILFVFLNLYHFEKFKIDFLST